MGDLLISSEMVRRRARAIRLTFTEIPGGSVLGRTATAMKPVMPALNFRVFAVPVLIVVLATGCAQQRSLATTAEQDCSHRFSGQSDKYTLLGLYAPSPRSTTFAVMDAREDQRAIALKAALKTLGEPATAKLPVEAELAKAEAELAREKAEAEAVNRKLDEIEARVEAGRAQMGECFGVGFSGEQAAERYARVKNHIATNRGFVARELGRALEKNRAAAGRAALVERWRADNALHLKRKVGNADLEIVDVARLGSFGRVSLRVTVAITNTTSSTILRPRNWPRPTSSRTPAARRSPAPRRGRSSTHNRTSRAG